MKRMKSLWMLLATVLLASYSFQTASADGHKIVVIADPHVTAASLVTNPNNSEWETCLNSDRKLLDYSLALFEQAVTEITAAKPDQEDIDVAVKLIMGISDEEE